MMKFYQISGKSMSRKQKALYNFLFDKLKGSQEILIVGLDNKDEKYTPTLNVINGDEFLSLNQNGLAICNVYPEDELYKYEVVTFYDTSDAQGSGEDLVYQISRHASGQSIDELGSSTWFTISQEGELVQTDQQLSLFNSRKSIKSSLELNHVSLPQIKKNNGEPLDVAYKGHPGKIWWDDDKKICYDFGDNAQGSYNESILTALFSITDQLGLPDEDFDIMDYLKENSLIKYNINEDEIGVFEGLNWGYGIQPYHSLSEISEVNYIADRFTNKLNKLGFDGGYKVKLKDGSIEYYGWKYGHDDLEDVTDEFTVKAVKSSVRWYDDNYVVETFESGNGEFYVTDKSNPRNVKTFYSEKEAIQWAKNKSLEKIESSRKITSSVIDKILGRTSEYCENYLIRLGYKPLEFNKQNRPIEFKNDKDNYIYVSYDSMGYVEDFDEDQYVDSSCKITSSKYEFEIHDMDGYAEYPITMTDAWDHVFDVSGIDTPYPSYDAWKEDVLEAIDDDEFVNDEYLGELYDYQNDLCNKYYGHDLIANSYDGNASFEKHRQSGKSFLAYVVSKVGSGEFSEEQAVSTIMRKNNCNSAYARKIFENAMNDGTLVKSGIMEIADEINKDFNVDGDLSSWFKDYVPKDGKSSTVGGELVRAANQIINRYNNDGDKIGFGIGKETCNPAARYIIEVATDFDMNDEIERMLNGDDYSEDYDVWVDDFKSRFTDYLRDREELFHSVNKNDMWDYKQEDDIDTSVDECYVVDGYGNEYWFDKQGDDWICATVNFAETPEFEVGDVVSSFGVREYVDFDEDDDFIDFVDNGFSYSAEKTGDNEWEITNVELENGLANESDYWTIEDFERDTVYDANGREISTKDLM